MTPNDPLKIPKHLRPEKFGGDAGNLPVFELHLSSLSPELSHRLTSPTHGMIEPRTAMPLATYQSLLCATKPNWREV